MKTAKNIVLASLLAAGTSQAALVLGVTVESFSAQNTGFNRFASYTVDGSGLTGTAPGVMGGQHNNIPGGNMWMVGAPDFTTGSITYNLGSVYSIDSFRVWNYNENNLSNRGFQNVTITYGETAALDSTLTSVTAFAQAPGTNGYTGEEFTFAPISAQYVRIQSSSNYGGDETGLSEIQFNAVPEPSSTAAFGIGALALILRRRK